ncbi:tail fiber domain-containing protein [Patescibacteria group bacterium]|nr:tail fiber domain-containing protein [Patescibacteria group bacterium]
MTEVFIVKRIAFVGSLAVLLFLIASGNSQAANGSDIQPADDLIYYERLRVNSSIHVADSSYYPRGVHLGSIDGTGGVIFTNGSIINASDGSVPVTFGDDVRIDGRIWRGPSAGPGDSFPVKIYDDLRVDGQIWAGRSRGNTADGQSIVIADTVRPALDNINDFGSPGFRMRDGFFSGSVNMSNLGGANVVHEDNLSTTNDPQAGYVLAYDSDNRFQWVRASTSSSGTLSDNDWTGAGSGKMYATSEDDYVGIGLTDTNNITARLHVVDNTNTNSTVYGEANGIGSAALYGLATAPGSTAVYGSGDAYGGDFSGTEANGVGVSGEANGVSGIGVEGKAAHISGTGVKGEASATDSGTNYGGDFSAAGTTGVAVRGQATSTSSDTSYGGYFSAAGSAGMGVRGEVSDTSLLAASYGGYFSSATGLGRGVYGYASNTLGINFGGYFKSDSVLGSGVYGTSPYFGVNAYATPAAGATTSAAVVGQNYDSTTAISLPIPVGNYGAFLETTHDTGTGVYGHAADTDGVNYGGTFISESSNGYGLFASGGTRGGSFIASAGVGVSSLGTTHGGSFIGSAGPGVYALGATNGIEATAAAGAGVSATGTAYGVEATASAGAGVKGTGTTYGGDFLASSGTGVRGIATTGTGVSGTGDTGGGSFTASSGTGVYSRGTTYGAYLTTITAGGIGVEGYAGTTGSSANYGVLGQTIDSGAGTTVWGDSLSGGRFYTNYASGIGVESYTDGDDSSAVYGYTSGGGTSYSGEFSGANFKVSLGPSSNNFTVENLPIAGNTTDVQTDGNGNFIEVGSSRRYKYDIQDLVVDKDAVLDLRPVNYKYKRTDERDIGLIAEEVYEVLPELVVLDKEEKPKSVKYDRVPVYLLELAKEQQATIESQETRIQQLEDTICKYLPQEEMCSSD